MNPGHSKYDRQGQNSFSQGSPLSEEFYRNQLKNKYNYNDKAIDEYQREIFVSNDRLAHEQIAAENNRAKQLKSLIMNENRLLAESKKEEQRKSLLLEQRAEQARILQAQNELQMDRQKEIQKKLELRKVQSQGLAQQIQSKDTFVFVPPSHSKAAREPLDELKVQMMQSVKDELHKQIQHKKLREEREHFERVQELQKARVMDQFEKEKDFNAKKDKVRQQLILKQELDMQIKNRNAIVGENLSHHTAQELSYPSNVKAELPRRGKGRGIFSSFNQPPNPLW